MPTAIVEVTSDGRDIGVRFSAPRGERLPEGFAEFGVGEASGRYVWVYLAKSRTGEDTTPLLVAADWLRDRGWDVQPHPICSFCRKALSLI